MFQAHLVIARRNLIHDTLNDVDTGDVLLHELHGPYFIWQISFVHFPAPLRHVCGGRLGEQRLIDKPTDKKCKPITVK